MAQPYKAVLLISIYNKMPFGKVRDFVHSSICNHYDNKNLTTVSLTPECCHIKETFEIKNIPLEDYRCQCGESFLIKYNRVNKSMPKQYYKKFRIGIFRFSFCKLGNKWSIRMELSSNNW